MAMVVVSEGDGDGSEGDGGVDAGRDDCDVGCEDTGGDSDVSAVRLVGVGGARHNGAMMMRGTTVHDNVTVMDSTMVTDAQHDGGRCAASTMHSTIHSMHNRRTHDTRTLAAGYSHNTTTQHDARTHDTHTLLSTRNNDTA